MSTTGISADEFQRRSAADPRLGTEGGMTITEFGLWLDQLGFAREVRFRDLSGTRQFRFDWSHDDLQIAIEYDGIMFGQASHVSLGGLLRDAEKSNEAALCGWLLIRVNAKTVTNGQAQRWIEAAMRQRGGAADAGR